MHDRTSFRAKKTKITQEQRKHTRVKHTGSVVVSAEGGTFAGNTVNISRSGMQLVVNMPASYYEIRSIAFTLPSSTEILETPCRLVRAEKNGTSEQETLLGVEICWQSEAQMLLIENFIKDSKSNALQNGSEESRLLPRSQCVITGVSTNRSDLKILSIDNISSEGLLLRFQGNLETGNKLSLEFSLPGDDRALQLDGEVLYVIENMTLDSSAAGITFHTDSPIVQARIKNFIVTSASGSAMRDICEGLATKGVAHEFRIASQRQIIAILRRLQDDGLPLNSLFEGNLQLLELNARSVNSEAGTWTAGRADGALSRDLASPIAGYFSFFLDGGSYYFKSDFSGWNDGTAVFKIPRTLYRSEKRSYQRQPLEASESVSISLQAELAENQIIQGKVLDISQHGLLCEIPHSAEILQRVYSGKPLQYSLRDKMGKPCNGEIRHFSQTVADNGELRMRIGVEAGVVRGKCAFRRITSSTWNRMRSAPEADLAFSTYSSPSEVVRYNNNHGQEIVALLNRVGNSERPSPVVIIPPAFGKKKEAMAALAATLIANFKHYQQDLVVLRYDGINRPGESFSEEKNLKRGYEMLRYRVYQGIEDLKTTLDFVADNPYFLSEKVALVSSSMSALDCRKLLSTGERSIHSWISLMGMPAAQTVLINTLGGLDIIGNARMGIPNSINGLLGFLVDMDILARDLIEYRCAYLSDARQDLARISASVLWICGSHDRWVSREEVRDIMSVHSGADRAILEVPTGHNLRSSEDALRTFGLITSWLYHKLFCKKVAAYSPDMDHLMKMLSWERERLLQPQSIQVREYWRSYLIGTEKNSQGYDFYRNIEDFRSFLIKQAELVRPEEGGRIADMGCGTGLMVEQLLERTAAIGHPDRRMIVSAIDIVPEALDRTSQKWAQALQRHPGLEVHMLECLQMDLSPNKLIPVRNFIDNPNLPLASLRSRVEGLTNGILDGLQKSCFPGLRGILAGEPISAQTTANLRESLRPEESAVVFDFNRIARFLKKRLLGSDLISANGNPHLPLADWRYGTLKASELRMERLAFGSCGVNLQLPLGDAFFDKVIASLFLSYLQNPDDLVADFFRILKPGGLLLASSMKPDSDISTIFMNYIEVLQNRYPKQNDNRNQDFTEARNMLNEAAGLFRLEEDGYFRFYAAEKLQELLESAGFKVAEVVSSFGNPSQATIVLAQKPL